MKFRLALLIPLAIAIAPASAAAQSGLTGSVNNLAVNSDAPIHIESDVLEIDEPKSVATFRGQVRAKQDNMQMTTDRLEIRYSASGGGSPTQLRTIDAVGNVVVRVDDQVAKGDNAHYDFAKEEVTLTGSVVLSQGDQVIRGDSIIVDLTTGRARVISSAQEVGERVRAVFTPSRN